VARLDSLAGGAFEVRHLAVAAGLQPALEVGGGIGRTGGGELAGVEAQFQGAFSNGGLHFFQAMWN
jgi:hypothetical protein